MQGACDTLIIINHEFHRRLLIQGSLEPWPAYCFCVKVPEYWKYFVAGVQQTELGLLQLQTSNVCPYSCPKDVLRLTICMKMDF